MKKRSIVVAMVALMAVSAITGRAGKAIGSDSTFTPRETINWTVASSPGSGSGVYTRMVSDIMAKGNLVNGQPIAVTNKTDGSGEIDRNEVATTKGSKADYTLLTFNSGGLVPMVQNTKNRSSDLRILAIMVVDKQLIFKGEQVKYADFKEAIKVTRNGTKIVIGGFKGDDVATCDAVLEEIRISKDVMSYTAYGPTDDAITTTLGGHVEFVISKPAAASEYVTAGSLIPVLALSTEWYTGDLADTPTLSEIGDYEDMEIPVWRGVAAPTAINDAATAYWNGQLGKVAGTDTWKNDYLEKNKLVGNYMGTATATEYVTTYEKDYMTANGIQ